MKQNNMKQEEVETSPKMSGVYDALISELALNDMFGDMDVEEKEKSLANYLKTVLSQLEKLSDITKNIEKDPRMSIFLERLVSGENRKEAFDGAGLSELIEGIPSAASSASPKELSEEIRNFFKDKGADKRAAEDFIAFVETVVSQICDEELGADVLDVLWLAFMHENDVRKSYDAGVIQGQNKKIESLRFERNNVDGLGAIGGGAVSSPSEKKMGYIERLMKNN